MTHKTEHTPTPWRIDDDNSSNIWIESSNGEYIADISSDSGYEEAKANADFIVRACNSHAELLFAINTAKAWLIQVLPDLPYKVNTKDLKMIDAVIAKAEGK